MEILKRIKDKLRKKEIHLDPSSVKQHQINKALQYAYTEEKAKRNKAELELAKYRQSEEDKEEEEEVKLVLNKKKEKLERVKSMKYFSLLSFFRKLLKDKKFARNLSFTDFDRKQKIDKFSDMGISEDGDFVIVGKDRGVILKLSNPKDVFFSPGGLNNDVFAGMVPLCIDKDGGYVENILEYEVPEIQKKGLGLYYNRARKRPVYEIITEKNNEIIDLKSEIEDLETQNTEITQENDDLKRSLRVNESSVEALQNDMSMVEKSGTNTSKALNRISNRLSSEINKNILLEDDLERLERQFESLKEKVESKEVMSSLDKGIETIQNIRRELVRDMPEKEVRIVEKPDLEPQNVQK